MEATHSEMLVPIYVTTSHNIPEDSSLALI